MCRIPGRFLAAACIGAVLAAGASLLVASPHPAPGTVPSGGPALEAVDYQGDSAAIVARAEPHPLGAVPGWRGGGLVLVAPLPATGGGFLLSGRAAARPGFSPGVFDTSLVSLHCRLAI